MDERVRRCKSLWEAEDVNLRNCWSGKEQYSSHNIGYSHKFSTFEADNNLSMPKDQAYAGKRMYRGVQDEPGIRERGLNKNFYKSMYPGFDGWDRRKRSRSRDDGLVHSSRYLERRSRSRSRDRGTSRSRSRSRGRDKDRMRIRSRSRSRRRNGARGRTRSRSPLYDHRRESDMGNATSKSGLSSHICRDFTAGNCRRGSQCCFLHPDGMDGDRSDDFNERRRSGQERGRAMIYGEGPGIQSLDKVTDSSYGEDDSFRNTDSGKICCRDFVRGNCKMGASCRFSHHSGSGDNIAKSTRNASIVRDSQHQSREKSKSLCKYFLAGKCNRGDCWFSHDDPADGKHERRSHDEGDHQGSAVKNKVWNGPTWDQTPESDIGKGTKQSEHAVANQNSERRPHNEGDCHGLAVKDKVWNGHNWDQTPESDITKGTGWSEHIVANHNSERRSRDEGDRHALAVKNIEWNGPTWDQTTESDISKGTGWSEGVGANRKSDNAAPSEKMDNKWAPEGRSWGSPELKEKASEKNCFASPHVWNDGIDRDSVVSKSVGGNVNDRNEYPPISQGLELGSLDEVSTSSHAQNITQKASGNHLSLPISRNDVSINSDTQQHAMVVKDNLVKPFSYDGLGEVNALGNTINSEFLSRKNTFSYERLSDVKELGCTVNPEIITRKSPNQNSVGIRNFNQSSVSSDQRDNLFFQHPSNLQNFDLNGPSQVLSSSFNMQNRNEIFQKEAAKTPEMQEFGARQSFFSSAPSGQVAQFFPTPTVASPVQKFEQAPAHVHTVLNLLNSSRLASTLQNSMHIQLNPLGDGRWQKKDQTSGYSLERVSQIPLEQFSPMSGNGIELEEALPNDSSMAHFLESPKSKQQGTHAVSELKKPEKTAVSELKEQEAPAITEQKEQEAPAVLAVKHSTNSVVEFKEGKENISKENGDGHCKVENGSGNKDDKDIRLFKNALVESVKEILKPTWRLGRMSREVHKTIVKKVVDKVTTTHQADHIPRTQDKIDQYLSHSKPKISKLVQAYVDRHLKAESS